jgi:hypothetical protein
MLENRILALLASLIAPSSDGSAFFIRNRTMNEGCPRSKEARKEDDDPHRNTTALALITPQLSRRPNLSMIGGFGHSNCA